MATYAWDDLIKQAEEAGLEYELQPPGEYHTEIVKTNVKKSQGGKDQIGVQHKILDGPRAGKSFWDSITISPENPKAMAIFFKTVSNYGGDINVLRSGGTLEQLTQPFIGRRGVVNLQHRSYNNKTYHDVKSFRPDVGGAAPAVPPAPQPVAPVPQAAPVPEQAVVPPAPAQVVEAQAVVAAASPAVPF